MIDDSRKKRWKTYKEHDQRANKAPKQIDEHTENVPSYILLDKKLGNVEITLNRVSEKQIETGQLPNSLYFK